jgi:hypothetical protein
MVTISDIQHTLFTIKISHNQSIIAIIKLFKAASKYFDAAKTTIKKAKIFYINKRSNL